MKIDSFSPIKRNTTTNNKAQHWIGETKKSLQQQLTSGILIHFSGVIYLVLFIAIAEPRTLSFIYVYLMYKVRGTMYIYVCTIIHTYRHI